MANKPHFQMKEFADGIAVVELSSWKWFGDYIQKTMLNRRNFCFRGQRKAVWPLESTLDREIRRLGIGDSFDEVAYLKEFMFATRGRRGPNPKELDEDEWWAVGQHQGLATPLLDWTESPFVALFFAFAKPRDQVGDRRAVWAISIAAIADKSKELAAANPPVAGIRFIMPQTDENPRLVSQRGLFTRGPTGTTHEDWIRKHFSGFRKQVLIKIVIPERASDRHDCLKFLNRMNINYLTLFPDLYGSCKYCTMSLEIPNY